jgi:hypothetical protein
VAGQVVDLAGVATYVHASDVARAEAMAAGLRAAAPTADQPTVRILFDDRDVGAPAWALDDDFEVQHERDGVVFVKSDVGLVARVTHDDVTIAGSAPDLTAAFRRIFWIALAQLLAQRDRHVVHAAMFSVDDGCVLAFGPTGAGKSTLALAALRAGWTVLGDDAVVLDCSGDRIFATALPRPIAAPAEVVDDARATSMQGDARRRLELPPTPEPCTPVAVNAVVVVTHGDTPRTAVHRVGAIDVLPIILYSCFVAHDANTVRARLPLAAALSRLPAMRLAHGTEVATRIGDGAAALARVHDEVARHHRGSGSR